MKRIKKTKIIATLGPSSSSSESIEKLIKEGVDVLRINFSHSSHKEAEILIKEIRKLNQKLSANTSILADLQGPKLRIGEIKSKVTLIVGNKIKITVMIDMDQENDTPKKYSSSSDEDESSSDDKEVGFESGQEPFTNLVKEGNKSKVKEALIVFEVKLIKGGNIKRKFVMEPLSTPTKSKCDDLELIISIWIAPLLEEGERVGKFTSIVVDKTINAT